MEYLLSQSDHVCGEDGNDIINGFPMGSIRISMGYMTKIEDIKAVVKMIAKCFFVKDKKCEKYRTMLDKQYLLSKRKNHMKSEATDNKVV